MTLNIAAYTLTIPVLFKAGIVFCVLLLTACASRAPDGTVVIDCSGFFEDMSDCIEAADAMCAESGGYVARWFDNDPEGRRMRVRCANHL